MIQLIFIGALFIAALVYLGLMLARAFSADHACSAGCAKCAVSAVNFEKIERQIQADSEKS